MALEPDAGEQQESPTTQAEPRRRNRGGRKAAGRVKASGENLTGSVPAKTSEAVRSDEPTAPAEAGSAGDPKREMLKLIDLAAKYPEIGPPLAELAFKIGRPDFGNRIVRMGLDRDGPGLEYYFVAAHSARRG